MLRRLLLVLVIVAAGAVSAQEDGIARTRVVNLLMDVEPLQAVVGEAPLGDPIDPGTITDYVVLPAGSYEVSFGWCEDDCEPVVPQFTVEVEAGHDYTLILSGDAEANLVEVIDETAAAEGIDVETEVPLLFINAATGAPAVSLWVDGEAVVENVAYGEFMTATLPIGAVDEVLVTSADDPEDILLMPPFFTEFIPDVKWLLAPVGTYPGEPGVDIFLFATPYFIGEISLIEAGDVEVGTPIDGIVEIGERATYTLSLDEDAILDLAVRSPLDSGLDPYLRVYDAESELVAENDEESFEDDALDAALTELELPAGEYIVEAGSFNDSSAAGYTLTIETSE